MKPFLTAEWRHLILLTYAVDPVMLEPHLPKGLELDLYKEKAFLSFVAFDFLKTRVKGIPIPFHINFPEVNLRFYVKRKDKGETIRRGVVFIREFVPKFMIAWVAQKIYNEPYLSTKMKSSATILGDEKIIKHSLQFGGVEHSWKFACKTESHLPEEGSTEHFFKEHEWGFGTNHKGQLMVYRVEHPFWKIYPLSKRFELKVDFGVLYGDKWSFLNQQIPYNIMIAEGSPIKVFPGTVLEE